MARRKREEQVQKEEPLFVCTLRVYGTHTEAEFENGIEGLGRSVLNKAVRSLFREFHKERAKLVRQLRPRKVEDVERESDYPLRHKDDKHEIEYPAAS